MMTARMPRAFFAQYNTGKIQECTVSGTVTGHMGGQGLQEFPQIWWYCGRKFWYHQWMFIKIKYESVYAGDEKLGRRYCGIE